MYVIYVIILVVLLSILMNIYREERRLRLGVSHGKLDRYLILRERRRYVRFKDDILVQYKTIRNPAGIIQDGVTKDLSKVGLGLVINERLKVGELLEIDFKVPEFKNSIRAVGQVIWIREIKNPEAGASERKRLFRTGINFKKIDPESEAMLILYLNQNFQTRFRRDRV